MTPSLIRSRLAETRAAELRQAAERHRLAHVASCAARAAAGDGPTARPPGPGGVAVLRRARALAQVVTAGLRT